MLEGTEGITRTHVVNAEVSGAASLCLHYDPDLVSVRELQEMAAAAGATVTRKYGHAVLPIRAVGAEDAARGIESGLGGIAGVLTASVNLAAQRAGVEFDRELVDVGRIRAALQEMGYASAPPATAEPGPGCCRPRPHGSWTVAPRRSRSRSWWPGTWCSSVRARRCPPMAWCGKAAAR